MTNAAAGRALEPVDDQQASRPLTLAFTLLVLVAVVQGVRARDEFYLSPSSGLGYALGVIGGSMMLLLLLYPLRKTRPFMRRWGPIGYWFRLHMVLGIVGPVCVLFHCNFSLGATNSNVALLCMALMVSSGLVGRFIYATVHHGLYGQRITLQELDARRDLAETLMRDDERRARPLPEQVAAELEVLRAWATQRAGPLTALWRVLRTGRRSRALRRLIAGSMRKTARPGQPLLETHLDDYVTALAQLVRFDFYERLFAWWHALHMPIFVMLILTGVIHVWAVHNY